MRVTDGRTVRCEAPLTIFPRVSGRVHDPQGQPAANVMVTVHPFGDHIATDAQGKFELGYDPRFGASANSWSPAIRRADGPPRRWWTVRSGRWTSRWDPLGA